MTWCNTVIPPRQEKLRRSFNWCDIRTQGHASNVSLRHPLYWKKWTVASEPTFWLVCTRRLAVATMQKIDWAHSTWMTMKKSLNQINRVYDTTTDRARETDKVWKRLRKDEISRWTLVKLGDSWPQCYHCLWTASHASMPFLIGVKRQKHVRLFWHTAEHMCLFPRYRFAYVLMQCVCQCNQDVPRLKLVARLNRFFWFHPAEGSCLLMYKDTSRWKTGESRVKMPNSPAVGELVYGGNIAVHTTLCTASKKERLLTMLVICRFQ